MILSYLLAAVLLMISAGCQLKKNKSDPGTTTVSVENIGKASNIVSSEKDGEWVRIDTGKTYYLSNQSFYQKDSPADAATFDSDDGTASIYTKGDMSLKIDFVSNDLVKIEQTTTRSSKPLIFHLLRRGVETATTKGQIKISGSSQLRLTEGSTTEVVLTNTNDASKSVEITLDEEGNFETSEIESGDYKIEIKTDEEAGERSDSTIIVNDIRVDEPGDDAGVIMIHESAHNFKTTLVRRSEFSFNGETYDATILVQNIGTEMATGVNYTLNTTDENLVLLNAKGILDSIPAGTTKSLTFQYQIKDLAVQSKVMKIDILLKDTNGNSWNDYATIEGWKRRFSLSFATLKNVPISGLAIFDNRSTYFFDVPGSKVVNLPVIEDGEYKFALSAQSLDQESVYSVSLSSSALKPNLSDFTDTSLYEPNNSEEKATALQAYDIITSYIHVGDIDFFTFKLPKDAIPEGAGTSTDPYLLKSTGHLDYVNNSLPSIDGSYMKLKANLDLSGRTAGITKLGFAYNFDGENHTLSNFKVQNESSKYFGFFEQVKGDTVIQNLVLKNFNIRRDTSDGVNISTCMGALVGDMSGDNALIRNITVLNSNVDSAGGNAGILAGCTQRVNIENIKLDTIFVNSSGSSGGLVGTFWGNFDSPTAFSARKVQVLNSAVYSSQGAGGIFGRANPALVSECSIDSIVNGNIAGGIAGHAGLSVSNCFSAARVTGTQAGGLLGSASNTTVQYSLAVGAVSGSAFAGGLIGGEPSSSNTIIDSFWDAGTTGQNTSAGTTQTGLTTSQLQTTASFTNWDFTSTWFAPTTGQYPALKWMTP